MSERSAYDKRWCCATIRREQHAHDCPGACDPPSERDERAGLSEAELMSAECREIGHDEVADVIDDLLDRLDAAIARAEAAEANHRDLVRRLGFGDNITEPMADNGTIVEWFAEQSRDASEWQESQLWRNDCYAAGHPDDEDCWECDPALRLEAAEARVAAALTIIEDGPDTWQGYDTYDIGLAFLADSVWDFTTDLRAALTTPTTDQPASAGGAS